MANHPSALKRMRQSEIKRVRNMSYKSQVKTAVKRFLRAVEENAGDAGPLLGRATSLLHKGVAKGIFHKNSASRAISRLAKKFPSA